MSSRRLFSLITILLMGIWGGHAFRPLIQTLAGISSCCLECKKNYCPAKTSAASHEKMPCHSGQTLPQEKLNRACSHSTDIQALHPDAVLVQWDLQNEESVFYSAPDVRIVLLHESTPPSSPPPKTT